MERQIALHIPVKRTLRKLGQDINEARRLRRLTVQMMAKRAGVSPTTVWKVEKGESGTSIAAYAAILFVLGMISRLGDLADASHDPIGLSLYESNLPQRVRPPGRKKYDVGA